MPSFETSDLKKIGLGLTAFGLIFSLIGVLLFFDKGFLTIGNILFLFGVIMTVGLKSTLQFFLKPQNYKGSLSLGVGFCVVLKGWPIIGIIVETYGFVVLLSEFWPTTAILFRRLPILGRMLPQSHVLTYPGQQKVRRVPV